MNATVVIPLCAFVVNLFALAFVFARTRRQRLGRAFIGMSLAATLWSGAEFFSWLPISDSILKPLMRWMAFFFAPVGALYYNFVNAVLERHSPKLTLAYASLSLLTAGLFVFTDMATTGVARHTWGPTFIRGPLYELILLVDIALPIVHGASLLAISLRQPFQRGIKALLLCGTALLFFVGIYTDVIQDETGISLAASASALLSIFLFAAIVRHGFMSIDVEAAAFHLFDYTVDAVLILDRQGLIQKFNRSAERLFEVENLSQMDVRKLLPAFVLGADYADHEFVVATALGRKVVSVSQSPVRQQGRDMGYIVMLRDLTKRQQLQDEIIKRQRLESVGVLAGGIAHDFNNALTGILSNLGLALKSTDEQERVELLHETQKATYDARHLATQLLTFARGGEPIRRAVRVQPVLESAVQLALSGSKVRARIECDPDLWAVLADKGQLGQAIGNIVVNSKQAMPRGGSVAVSANNVRLEDDNPMLLPRGRYVRIEVEDRGSGIEPQLLPSIFDPYFTTKPDGTGLGLASTYSIVQRHGGHIGVASRLGYGTTVTLHLPAVERGTPTTLPPAPLEPVLRGRVLLMDDDELILRADSKLLMASGFDVDVVRDGAEAIAAYRKAMDAGRKYDVVIMDLTVPGGVGGQEAVRWVLAIDPDAKVIVSSGYSTDPVMASYRDHGFVAVMAKPYTATELVELVARVIASPTGVVETISTEPTEP